MSFFFFLRNKAIEEDPALSTSPTVKTTLKGRIGLDGELSYHFYTPND